MRILIVSFNFPPYAGIGAVRVGKTARYLHELGHEVRVLTAPEAAREASLAVELPPEQVLRAPWRNPARRRSAAAGAGAAPTPGGGSQGAARRALRAGLRNWYRAFLFPDDKASWIRPACRAGLELTQDWRPELIFASALPPSSLYVAAALHRRLGCPWVAELRDLWAGGPYDPAPRWRRALNYPLERRLLRSAAGLVTVSRPLAEELRGRYGKPTAVVLNGFDEDDYPSPIPPPRGDKRLRIVYTGQLYGNRRDPGPLLEALAQMGEAGRQVELVFYLLGDPGPLRQALAACPVASQVRLEPPLPHREALAAQQQADALLLLLWDHPAEYGTYTGKLFEYLGARRPVLAVGPPEGVAGQLLARRGAGLTARDPAQIAAWLQELLERKARQGALEPLPPEALAGLSRREQTARLVGFLEALAQGRTPEPLTDP